MNILWPEPVAAEIIGHFRHTLETGEPYYSRDFVKPRHDVETVEAYEWELHRMTLPDGQYGVICYYYDSTALREAEEALQTALHRLHSLIANMHSSILLVGEGRIELANQAFCEYFGLQESPGDLVGLTPRQLIDKIKNAYLHPDEQVRRIWEIARGGQPVIGEEISMRGGRTSLRDFIPVHVDGKSYGLLWHHIDITKRMQVEQILRERTAELEALNKELESFSYSVSHDLRAPLRAIDGYARSIFKKQGDKFDDDTRRKFNDIRLNARMMGQLIDDLLAFSRLGKKHMSISKLDMDAVIMDVWKELQTANPERDMKLTLNSMPSGYGDRTLIKQVCFNLLANAVKFTKFRVPAHIEVGGCSEGNEDIYYIKDNGVGFNMAYYDKLFGVFQRLHNPDDFEGTGVGLATIQRIIHRHDGRVWAEGKVDEGATFYFSLPRKG
jgi:two-component system sensor kinase